MPGRPPGTRHIRCSNAERESVVDQLKQAYAEGRLDHEEFDQRVHLGMTAKTWGDLEAVLVGLAPQPRTAPYRPRRANTAALGQQLDYRQGGGAQRHRFGAELTEFDGHRGVRMGQRVPPGRVRRRRTS